jgi:hypothetical protein
MQTVIYSEDFDNTGFLGVSHLLGTGSDKYPLVSYNAINNFDGWTFTGTGTEYVLNTAGTDGAVVLNEYDVDTASTMVTGLTPGTTYYLSFVVYGDNLPGDPWQLNVSVDGVALLNVNGVDQPWGSNSGTTETISFNATGTSTLLYFTQTPLSAASPIIDDVKVYTLDTTPLILFGDTSGSLSGKHHGGDQTLVGTATTNTFYGDAGLDLLDKAHGGNDTFTGGAFATNSFFGDAGRHMLDQSVGGNDTFVGGENAVNLAYGDSKTMADITQGGNDVLIGGNDATPRPAGTYDNTLIGDAQTMSDKARGGNDKLVSGTGNDDMWGDAQAILGKAQGGNDTFVFNFANGHDKIEDFGQGMALIAGSNWGTDHIDVAALGIHDFSQLAISAFDPTTHDSTITFSLGNEVVVHSQVALSSHDFLFSA